MLTELQKDKRSTILAHLSNIGAANRLIKHYKSTNELNQIDYLNNSIENDLKEISKILLEL